MKHVWWNKDTPPNKNQEAIVFYVFLAPVSIFFFTLIGLGSTTTLYVFFFLLAEKINLSSRNG